MMSLRNDVVSQLGVEAYMYIYAYIHTYQYIQHTYIPDGGGGTQRRLGLL